MDQLIVLIVVGALALAKWLFENAGGVQSDQPDNDADEAPKRPRSQARPMAPRNLVRPGETEEEKMRRFMEALGLPPESAPPPARKPVAPTKPKPDMRHVGHPVSPASPVSRPQLPQPVAPTPVKPVVRPIRPDISTPLDTGGPLPGIPKTSSVAETAPAIEVASIPQMSFAGQEGKMAGRTRDSQRRQPSGAPAALKEQLRTPAALRNAILLREILSAPKGLQSTQNPTIFSPL